VDKRENQNCYNCRGFGHLTRNCRNRNRIGKGRRLEYGETRIMDREKLKEKTGNKI